MRHCWLQNQFFSKSVIFPEENFFHGRLLGMKGENKRSELPKLQKKNPKKLV